MKKKLKFGTVEDVKAMQKKYANEPKNNDEYKKYGHYFNNLYDNKIIYHERYTMIVRLEDLEVTEDYFKATAIRERFIMENPIRRERVMNSNLFSKWTFRGSWQDATYSENPFRIGQPYATFVVWTEPEVVKYIEQLVEKGDFKEIRNILWK